MKRRLPALAEQKPSIYDLPALEAILTASGLRRPALQRIRRQWFREGVPFEDVDWSGQADAVRGAFTESHLELVERQDSAVDGATKLLFRTLDGRMLETVILRIASGRTSLCVSSQTGCTEKCRFCATGAIQFFRNLHWYEILDQVGQASRLLAAENRQIRNIVFMGMGEALRNLKNLRRVITDLTTGKSFQFAPSHLCVSTLGLADKLVEFAREFPLVNLALSLNATTDAVRQDLMPINDVFNLAQLRDALDQLVQIRDGRETMISYVLFGGVNDSPADAAELARYLTGLPVHINLIPFNPDDASPADLSPSTAGQTATFQQVLRDRGYAVTRRYSLGQDVAAACGQLANRPTAC